MKKNYQILEFERIGNGIKFLVNKNSNYEAEKHHASYCVDIEFVEDQIIATKLFKINKVKCLDTGFIFEVGDRFMSAPTKVRVIAGFYINEAHQLLAYEITDYSVKNTFLIENITPVKTYTHNVVSSAEISNIFANVYEKFETNFNKLVYDRRKYIDELIKDKKKEDLKKQPDKVDMLNNVLNKFDAAVDKFFNDRKKFKDAEMKFDKYATVKNSNGGHTHRVDNLEPVNWEADSRIRQGTLDSPNICQMSTGGEPAPARKEVSDEYVLNAKLFSYNDIIRGSRYPFVINGESHITVSLKTLHNKAKELCGKK